MDEFLDSIPSKKFDEEALNEIIQRVIIQNGLEGSLVKNHNHLPSLKKETPSNKTEGEVLAQEVHTDNNFDFGTNLQTQHVSVDKSNMPEYNRETYLITGKKVCLLLVISEFDKNEYNRNNTENDGGQASEVLRRRGFEVISLVGRVNKNDFTKKLKEIRRRTDIGLFMLVVSSHGDENDNVMFSDNSYWDNGKPRCETK